MNLEPWLIFATAMTSSGQNADPPLRMIPMPILTYGGDPAATATTMHDLSSGRRVLYIVGFDRYHDDSHQEYLAFNDPADADAHGKYGLWVQHGVADMQTKWQNWFDAFSVASPNPGQIDLLVSDEEWNQLYLVNPDNDFPTQYPSDPPPWMNATYWSDQISKPNWSAYEFFGRTMADWLGVYGDPTNLARSLSDGYVDDWGRRDRHVGELLYNLAKRWWRRQFVHDTVIQFFPNCDFSQYDDVECTEENATEPLDGNYYPFTGWWPRSIEGTVNSPDIYMNRGRLDHSLGFPSGYVLPGEPADMSTDFPGSSMPPMPCEPSSAPPLTPSSAGSPPRAGPRPIGMETPRTSFTIQTTMTKPSSTSF